MTKVVRFSPAGKPARRKVPLAGTPFTNTRHGKGIILKVHILMEGEEETGYRIIVRYRKDPPRVLREYCYPKFSIQQLAA